MATADVRIVIERPVSEVFAFMADYDNNHRWQDGVTASRQVTDGPPRAGVEVSYSRSLLGRSLDTTATLAVHEPDTRLRAVSTGSAYRYEGGYDFTGEGSVTHVHYRGEITTTALLGFLGRALAGRFESQMRSDLENLKRRMEAGELG